MAAPPPSETRPGPVSGDQRSGEHAQPDWPAAFATLAARHEDQRHQASRLVHDRIAQALSAIHMSASLGLEESDLAQLHEDLAGIMAAADQAMRESRGLEHALRPPLLESLGLAGALRMELGRRLEPASGRTHWLELDPADLAVDPAPAIACIRIVQGWLEAVLADPDSITVRARLSARDPHLCLVELRCESAGDGPQPTAQAWNLWLALAASCGGRLAAVVGGCARWPHGIDITLPIANQGQDPDPDPGRTSHSPGRNA